MAGERITPIKLNEADRIAWLETQIASEGYEIRIEALRSATTIVAAQIAVGGGFLWDGKNISPNEYLLRICPQFAAWLETGER